MGLQKIIYNTLTGSTDVSGYTSNRIYHKHLPVDFKINQITTVFILNQTQTESSFDFSNEIEIWDVDIKLNYITSAELYEYAEVVKSLMLSINNEKILWIGYNGDDLVYNPNYQFYNLNLSFTIHYENK